MIDVLKSVLDPDGILNIDISVYSVIAGILLVVCFVLVIKFLLDFVRGLFPSFK